MCKSALVNGSHIVSGYRILQAILHWLTWQYGTALCVRRSLCLGHQLIHNWHWKMFYFKRYQANEHNDHITWSFSLPLSKLAHNNPLQCWCIGNSHFTSFISRLFACHNHRSSVQIVPVLLELSAPRLNTLCLFRRVNTGQVCGLLCHGVVLAVGGQHV